jgi:CRISPR system Cascade subunit CasE
MYLSQLILNPEPSARQVQRDLASPYELHRTVMRAFPDASAGGPGRVLFRLEIVGDGQPPVVLVQSDKRPDWTPLMQIPNYLLGLGEGTPKEVDLALLSLRPGQRLRFRLRANPTVRSEGKRHGLVRYEDQCRWLDRKAAAAGFAPVDVAIRRAQMSVSRSAKGTQSHFVVDFEGLLEVTDPAGLRTAVAAGIGPAKGYGLGLLSLAPA